MIHHTLYSINLGGKESALKSCYIRAAILAMPREEPHGVIDMRGQDSEWRAAGRVLRARKALWVRISQSQEPLAPRIPRVPLCHAAAADLRQIFWTFLLFGLIGPFWAQISLIIKAG